MFSSKGPRTMLDILGENLIRNINSLWVNRQDVFDTALDFYTQLENINTSVRNENPNYLTVSNKVLQFMFAELGNEIAEYDSKQHAEMKNKLSALINKHKTIYGSSDQAGKILDISEHYKNVWDTIHAAETWNQVQNALDLFLDIYASLDIRKLHFHHDALEGTKNMFHEAMARPLLKLVMKRDEVQRMTSDERKRKLTLHTNNVVKQQKRIEELNEELKQVQNHLKNMKKGSSVERREYADRNLKLMKEKGMQNEKMESLQSILKFWKIVNNR